VLNPPSPTHTHTHARTHAHTHTRTHTHAHTQLFKYLDQLIREEGERRWTPPDDGDGAAAGSARVLGSANALFLKIRASLTRCVRLVSRGQTLLGLAGAFKVGWWGARGTVGADWVGVE